jgi:hypothetical protein
MNATATRKTTRPAKSRTTPADDGWRALALTTVAQSIDRYWEAKVQSEDAYAQYRAAEVASGNEASKEWETWTDAAYSARHAAERERVAAGQRREEPLPTLRGRLRWPLLPGDPGPARRHGPPGRRPRERPR